MKRIYWIGLMVNFLFSNNVYGQEEEEKKWELRGYVSNMMTFDWSTDTLHLDNLVHNRLNLKWFPTEFFNIKIDLRNRIFAGNSVKAIPGFEEIIDGQNGYFDLSVQFPEKKAYLVQSVLDRAYVEWYKDNWEIRLGRQRINWGVNLIWNPNDLFNAYSFYDFDYVERPGSDALLFKKYIGATSSLEFAMNAADDFNDIIMAGRYSWNKWDYDFQLIAAKANRDIVFGMAWAGNIKKAGFKGEASFFYPYESSSSDKVLLMAVVSADYAFKNTVYLHTGVLFNSDGSDEISFGTLGISDPAILSARTLSPFTWSVFFQSSYQIHSLLASGLAIIYFPGKRNALFINPSMSYSLKEDLDIGLFIQWYYDDLMGDYKAYRRSVYLRAKWSF